MFSKLTSVLILAAAAFTLGGCTAVEVRPLSSSLEIKHLYIRDNPKVIVTDFVDVMRDGFARHGIASEVIPADQPAPGKYVVTYTALRSWDFAPYLSVAAIRIEKDGVQIASADYHLRGKGGYSLMKWQGTKAKMDPVIDQLLAGINNNNNQPAAPTAPALGTH